MKEVRDKCLVASIPNMLCWTTPFMVDETLGWTLNSLDVPHSMVDAYLVTRLRLALQVPHRATPPLKAPLLFACGASVVHGSADGRGQVG